MTGDAREHVLVDLLRADLGAAFRRAFRLAEVAEAELACEGDPPGAFMLLMPPVSMFDKDPAVYRSHVRELLRRIARGEDTRPATDAECLCALSAASLDAPLSSTPAALFERLFARVMPGRVPAGDAVREPYVGACDELLGSMRRRLADGDRLLERMRHAAA